MQKSKKAVVACLVLALLLLSLPLQVFGLEFSDVPITASYYKAVDKLSNIGIIQGRGDGAFAPVDKTTRAEFCAFLARANGYNANYYQPKALPFPDVDAKHWATPYISFCYENGYINGMLDGTFCPNDYVTDEQAVKMIVCSSGVGDESLSKVGPKWYSGYLNVAQKYDLLTGTRVRVSNSANRAFVAQVVYNAMMVDGSLEPTVTPAPEATPEPSETPEPSATAKPTATAKPSATPKPTPRPTRKPVAGQLTNVLDPGHNYDTTDTGATYEDLREQDITFAIAAKAKPLLEANGFYVIMTRNELTENVSEESVVASLKKRAEIANEAEADLFLSIHCNAGGGNGTETYYFEGSEEGEILAELIQEQVTASTKLYDRGTKTAKFVVLNETAMVSALLETAFIDDPSNAKFLSSKNGQQAFAEGIAKGICAFFGRTYKK